MPTESKSCFGSSFFYPFLGGMPMTAAQYPALLIAGGGETV